MTQIWEIRGLPSLACDLYHLRRHHPLFSWMAPLQNTVRLRDYHDFFFDDSYDLYLVGFSYLTNGGEEVVTC